MQWYRAYDGTVSDPKLAEVALVAGVSRSVAIASWHAILENACSVGNGGEIDITPRRVAVMLSEPIPSIEAVFQAFEEVGLINESAVTNWSKRQYQSDKSTDRVRRHRRKKAMEQGGTVDETFHETVRNVSETPETVSVTDQNRADQNRADQIVAADAATQRSTREKIPSRNPISADWWPSDAELSFVAQQTAFNPWPADKLERVIHEFVAYYRSKGALSADWGADFRRWVLKQPRFEQHDNAGPDESGYTDPFLQACAREVRAGRLSRGG